MRRHLANLMSISRLVLFVPWIFYQIAGNAWALPLMAAMVLTDLMDGWVARKLKIASPFGSAIDAACDALVCFSAALIQGLLDPCFFIPAALMVVNLLSWILCSSARGTCMYTRLGRYNGAACYGLALMMSASSPLVGLVPAAMTGITWVFLCSVVVILTISTGENVLAAYAMKRGAHREIERVLPLHSGRGQACCSDI